ncbi:hypothetical protein HYPBUDRAFT_197379 [Hyphopichia burtonii NRRL Y-1933]|uniref:Uncharacterized protein n=1 Tax=Hyphopichia burtonii NRRL Y-1933 TaxID=984485 RepID=A0A1E4RK41_9ASCO|nr:hypothetical protein HYPBUDRAFT_197379 [Hyphopichia burtonii NRRL Y-1933]ODV67639.1 hypothetical protein HYPBUDRAFT_197379 [Hyphopichia burtonii NRRL Y-1933]
MLIMQAYQGRREYQEPLYSGFWCMGFVCDLVYGCIISFLGACICAAHDPDKLVVALPIATYLGGGTNTRTPALQTASNSTVQQVREMTTDDWRKDNWRSCNLCHNRIPCTKVFQSCIEVIIFS